MSRVLALFSQLGVQVDPELYRLALTHRSFAYENGELPHNERLEFLGDSVLGVVVTEHLFTTLPECAEGRLAKLRAAVVNTHALADVARSLDLGKEILLGKGEVATRGDDKDSILADVVEAILGAVQISAGHEGAARVIHRLFDPLIDRAVAAGAGLDWKTSLQELCAQRGLGIPSYEVSDTGPDHEKHFTAQVVLEQWRSATGEGSNKKQAEQRAAEAAFNELNVPDA